MRVALLALALAAAPLGAAAQDAGWDEPEAEAPRDHRLMLSAWGGQAFTTGASGRGSSVLGGEVGWAFDAIDVGVAGYGYRGLRLDSTSVEPVLLLRLTERFQTARGLDAALTFGAGGARAEHWIAWFQVALGIRLDLGPLFLGGELAFEQYDLLRLVGGIGVKL